MAINPIDTSYSLIKEVAAGTTPATPAFLGIDMTNGGVDFNYTATQLESQTVKAGRAGAGSYRVDYQTNGSMSVEFCRGASIEALLEAALSGTWSSNVLKGSNTDTSFTIEEKRMDGATPSYRRFLGTYVNEFSLSVDYTGMAMANFGFMGLDRQTATTAVTGATYTAALNKPKFPGRTVSAITVGGLSLTYTSLNLTVSQPREVRGALGSTAGASVGVTGPRSITLELSAYRTDFAIETALLADDTPVAASFTIAPATPTGNGYTFSLPAAYSAVPQDLVDGSKQLVKLVFKAGLDTTAGTDIQITRL